MSLSILNPISLSECKSCVKQSEQDENDYEYLQDLYSEFDEQALYEENYENLMNRGL